MPNRSRCAIAFAALLLAGAAAHVGAARAQTGAAAPADKPEGEKSKLIYVDENGGEKVVAGTGTLVKRGYLGVELTELTPELRAHFGAPQGAGVMVARVVPGSPAEKAGLAIGDIITSLDGKPVESSWDVRSRVRALGDGATLPLEVQRDGKPQALTATVVQRERREMDLAPFLMNNGEADRIMGLRRAPGSPGSPEGGALDGTLAPRLRIHRLVSPREEVLEKKLKALEKRLNDLENRLPKPKN
jgi:membrane-associated protease RseP (regulator of RpoE activity)